MGFGIFFERKESITELRIMYPNGKHFTGNDGVAVPLQFTC
jgi:hypothetical protein